MNRYNHAKAVKRFWSYVDKSGDCWVWKGAPGKGGYGITSVKGKAIAAHRRAFIITYGEIPDGLLVCHECDNPPCVRPDHLFLGTIKDNADDAIKKNRYRFQTQPYRKVTEESVSEIRHKFSTGYYTKKLLGELYNLDPATIRAIVNYSGRFQLLPALKDVGASLA